jgi:molybdenum cofactor biosynthesis enzyme
MKKGPVLATAIIAGIGTLTDIGHGDPLLSGTMAAKKTSDLIPFCHPVSATMKRAVLADGCRYR